MKWLKLASFSDALEIIFEQRNREYGAYQLRKDYPDHLAKALALGLLFILTALGMPYLIKAVNPNAATTPKESKGCEYVLADLKTEKPKPLPALPEYAPMPLPKAIKSFTPPLVTSDEQVSDDVKRNDMESLLNTKAVIGSTNQEGETETAPDFVPPTEFNRTQSVESPPPPANDVYDMPGLQKAPSFPGGETALLAYLAKHVEYPAMASEQGIQGRVVLSFVVEKDGSIAQVSIMKDIGGSCGKEAVRVVKNMPKWSPGEANGHPVRVRFMLPVRFILNE